LKAILLLSLAILVALRVTGGVELCRHVSGAVHSFAGEVCEGVHAADHVKLSSSAHVNHGHQHDHDQAHEADADEHHEPCSHERFEGETDWRFASIHIDLPTPVASGMVAIAPDAWTLPQAGDEASPLERAPRAPPGTAYSSAHFAATVRLIV
jgi:hypothetical protein